MNKVGRPEGRRGSGIPSSTLLISNAILLINGVKNQLTSSELTGTFHHILYSTIFPTWILIWRYHASRSEDSVCDNGDFHELPSRGLREGNGKCCAACCRKRLYQAFQIR